MAFLPFHFFDMHQQLRKTKAQRSPFLNGMFGAIFFGASLFVGFYAWHGLSKNLIWLLAALVALLLLIASYGYIQLAQGRTETGVVKVARQSLDAIIELLAHPEALIGLIVLGVVVKKYLFSMVTGE